MLHLSILQRIMQTTGGYSEPQYCLSPTDRWAVGENKSTHRNGTLNLLQLSAERLGEMAAHSTICHKCKTLSNDKAGPIRTLDGIHTQSTSGQSHQQHSCDRIMQGTAQRS